MKLPYSEPDPAGSERARYAKKIRDLATEVSRLQPQAATKSNAEEADFSDYFPTNFTKGLKHNQWGMLDQAYHYRCLVEAINSPDQTLFEKSVPTFKSENGKYFCKIPDSHGKYNMPEWRGWESPRCGHVYELEGPDSGTVGMSPAPRVGTSEQAAEMAEVYALALLRDTPFTEISDVGNESKSKNQGCNNAHITPKKVIELLNGMNFFSDTKESLRYSSTPCNRNKTGLNKFERNRRYARTLSKCGKLTHKNIFRGSTEGAHKGPYLSQFLLIGTQSIAGAGTSSDKNHHNNALFGISEGYISYGSLVINQRTLSHTCGLDYMTSWASWLDVQNGANVGSAERFEPTRRFITTPRDLATYVHHDALYEAYLNACLILLAKKTPHSKGFPEPSASGNRDAFATFGDPHILSLVTEVATRCLKAVRRQKFNYHRRGRPETLAGRITLFCVGKSKETGKAESAYKRIFDEIPTELLTAISAHNKQQNERTDRKIDCKEGISSINSVFSQKNFVDKNALLPMAFPEGSPMHPSYGAGHATVAGGCVTMLKAFFEMYEDCDSGIERPLVDEEGEPFIFVPKPDGSALENIYSSCTPKSRLTIQGELDKLAANISIARNMAGVHFYSDYYDSLRMGERIAVGILIQQSPTYGDYMETTFKSFDGDHITISGEAGSCPSLSILDRHGNPVSPDDWWLRHVIGKEISEDLVL